MVMTLYAATALFILVFIYTQFIESKHIRLISASYCIFVLAITVLISINL